ncbi:MAG: hypothetical protein R3C05_21240 [Pirellulaceae bacterium]
MFLKWTRTFEIHASLPLTGSASPQLAISSDPIVRTIIAGDIDNGAPGFSDPIPYQLIVQSNTTTQFVPSSVSSFAPQWFGGIFLPTASTDIGGGSADNLFDSSNTASPLAENDSSVNADAFEESRIASREGTLFFNVILPSGELGEKFSLNIELLEQEGLFDLFATFPDDQYGVFYTEPDSNDAQQLFQITVDDGRIITTDQRDLSDFEPIDVANDPPSHRIADSETLQSDTVSNDLNTDEADLNGNETGDTDARSSEADDPKQVASPIDSEPLGAFAVPVAAASLALARYRSSAPWRADIHSAMERASLDLSKAGRRSQRIRAAIERIVSS